MNSFTEFHPAVADWFSKNLGDPSDIQKLAWPVLRKKEHALISAPTGSGKTLAAFLAIIDEFVKLALENNLPQESKILYISPLKALSNDVEKNLQIPLKGISAELEKRGLVVPRIDVMVRTGDSSPGQRAKMIRMRPQIIVTTPESLYVLLTSESGRNLLSTIETVIVDEIHAIISSRRGSHLALSLERLANLTGKKLQRIGISATVKPLSRVAEFLCPLEKDSCVILDMGHHRKTDIKLILPFRPLGAVMGQDGWAEIYKQLVEEISDKRTCLIFVNNRRLCERLARHLSDILGQDKVGAHHGSLSHAQRLRSENALKDGQLKVMVATASLELGIDIGSIDLVVQISSPRSIHTFLQRIGRSEHHKAGVSRAILIPLTRDDLVECTALLLGAREERLEEIEIPEAPLDILAQQIVAEVSARDYRKDELFAMIRRSYPYRSLSSAHFEEILDMLQEGYTLRFGKRARYIFYDRMQGIVQARRNARLSAITNGGAIAENFEYEVILEGESAFLGTVHEDFAIESLAGDVFQLGNQFWRILRISTGKVFVAPAPNSTPTMPFWIAEAPGRTDELSRAVSDLRSILSTLAEDEKSFSEFLGRKTGISESAIHQLLEYMVETKRVLGCIPTQRHLVIERFFDEVNDCHIVIHSPFGTRINRAWGLALRKRFCRKFNFELQAAASDDAILFSLSHTHSFVLEDVFSYIKVQAAANLLIQALLDAPMFEIRWRWNASRSLAILRQYGGRRVIPQFQKSQAQDLVALIFPDQIACAENIVGEREVPDHPLVRQTISDCLTEAMDLQGWLRVLEKIENGEIEISSVDSASPSPMTHEIINARPYAFLDDAPLEERRTRAVRTDLRQIEEDELPDEKILQLVKKDMAPVPRDVPELYDLLTAFGIIPNADLLILDPNRFLDELISTDRILEKQIDGNKYLLSGDKLHYISLLFPDWNLKFPESVRKENLTAEIALEEILFSHMELTGPMTASDLEKRIPVTKESISRTLIKLEVDGSVFRIPGKDKEDIFIERSFWQRIRHYKRTNAENAPEFNPEEFMQFLFSWQRIETEYRMQGENAVEFVANQLQGFSMPVESWYDIFHARITDFKPPMLDHLFLTGRYLWWKPVKSSEKLRRSITPNVPIMLISRELLPLVNRPTDHPELSHYAESVLNYLKANGASFLNEIESGVKLFSEQIVYGLKELIARGLITSDSLAALKSLFRKHKHRQQRISISYSVGRWSLFRESPPLENEQADLMVARLFLRRYGIVFRYIADREFLNRPWLSLVRTLRRLELQGEVRSGRFIKNVWGEQFALPEALALLKKTKAGNQNTIQEIHGYDPLNLAGILFSGDRIPAKRGSLVKYEGGRILSPDTKVMEKSA